ncbi:sepiapterin reductase b isoform X2 [Dicentrarchus labrax]|uniref:sepiapterin reductase b isoform X2 n=1 Tax=Dicentrarchus labrax TaxID=13489 RepID=UPI0021F61B89|nr:sepiapterin reductase b isoform X2 [Dicentrarchus labrax]
MQDIYSTNPKTLGRGICIITGASRGFGRALAQEVSYFSKPGSVLLLVARSNTMLQELKEELQSLTKDQQLMVHCIAVDLSTREGVHETVRVARQEAINEMDHVLLINNAGILQVFPCRPGLRWSVVNVSSVFATQALPSWVLYCTAKAARKMMFGVLAEEEPNVKVLSYSPGPMDTDMQVDIRRLTGSNHHLLPCQESAAKLMKLLLDNNFLSGKHLDFFEV